MSGIQCQLFAYPLDKIHMNIPCLLYNIAQWIVWSKFNISCGFIDSTWTTYNHNKYGMLFWCDLVWDLVSTVFPLDKIHRKITYPCLLCNIAQLTLFTQINFSFVFYRFYIQPQKIWHVVFMWSCLGFSVNCFPFRQDSQENNIPMFIV